MQSDTAASSSERQWVVCGLIFGVAAYFVMTWLVVPMSNAGNGQINFALRRRPC